MKKFFFTLLMAVMAFSISAQDVTTWGYSSADYSKLSGVGVQQVAYYSAMIAVPAIATLDGAEITAINIPFGTTNLKDVSVWVKTVSGTMLAQKTVDVATIKKAYNKIALESPVAITEPLFVGYTFTVKSASVQADQFPVMVAQAEASADKMYLGFANTAAESMTEMYDLTTLVDGVTLALSMDVTGYKEYNACVSIDGAKDVYAMPEQQATVKLALLNNSNVDVKNVEVEIKIDEAVTTQTVNVTMPAGIMQAATADFSIAVPAEVGTYNLTLTVLKVNGEENADKKSLSVSLNVLSRVAVRRTIVEEFTGTGCPNCPRGLAGMKALRDTYGDRFIGIAIHQYNTSDAMYNGNYANLGFTGAPNCRIDRGSEIDPYFGTGDELGILDNFVDANDVFATVDIDLTGAWTSDALDSVKLTATTTAIAAGNYSIAFVLTADSLYGTTSSWKQKNNLYQTSKIGEPYIDEFLSGGKYGKASFSYPFDDVLIGSSYVGTSNKAGKIGALAADESATVSYTIALPTKTTIRAAVDASIDKIYGIAIVTDKSGRVANANRVHVGATTAIFSVRNDEPCQKMLINGQLQIRRGDNCYDALGRIVK